MSIGVFVDTNILLDVLAGRKEFYRDAAQVWTLAELGRITGQVSVISFNNIYYVIRKHRGRATADDALRKLRNIFTPVALDAQVLNQAMDAGFDDFEDAIQYHSALHAGSSYIISRNADHFPRSAEVPVLSPSEFLAAFAEE